MSLKRVNWEKLGVAGLENTVWAQVRRAAEPSFAYFCGPYVWSVQIQSFMVAVGSPMKIESTTMKSNKSS